MNSDVDQGYSLPVGTDGSLNPPPSYSVKPAHNVPFRRDSIDESDRNDPPPNHRSSAQDVTENCPLLAGPRASTSAHVPPVSLVSHRDHLCCKISIWVMLFILLGLLAAVLDFYSRGNAPFEWAERLDGKCIGYGARETYARILWSRPWTSVCAGLQTADGVPPVHCSHNMWFEYGYWSKKDDVDCVPIWTGLESRGCTAYNTILWTATLSNVHYDPFLACAETPITLPTGQSFASPERCHTVRSQPVGHWHSQGHEECRPYWDPPRPGQCAAYGVRTYSALLFNVNYDPLQACLDTPLPGDSHRYAEQCRWTKHGLEGVWSVSDLNDCRPHWGNLKREWCTNWPWERGIRRYSARLWDIKRGTSWEAMCKTTPHTIFGYHFARPQYCYQPGFFNGIWGVWDVPDNTC